MGRDTGRAGRPGPIVPRALAVSWTPSRACSGARRIRSDEVRSSDRSPLDPHPRRTGAQDLTGRDPRPGRPSASASGRSGWPPDRPDRAPRSRLAQPVLTAVGEDGVGQAVARPSCEGAESAILKTRRDEPRVSMSPSTQRVGAHVVALQIAEERDVESNAGRRSRRRRRGRPAGRRCWRDPPRARESGTEAASARPEGGTWHDAQPIASKARGRVAAVHSSITGRSSCVPNTSADSSPTEILSVTPSPSSIRSNALDGLHAEEVHRGDPERCTVANSPFPPNGRTTRSSSTPSTRTSKV